MEGYENYPYPEGGVAYANEEREERGYSRRPTVEASLADMPLNVQESQKRTLFKAGSPGRRGGGLKITAGK